MKITRIHLAVAVVFLAGYLFGNFLPLQSLASSMGTIEGDAELKVTLLRDNGVPVPYVEVDVGKMPGPPPKGGWANTSAAGVAVFHLAPDKYVVYFNEANFPNDLKSEVREILVERGKTNEYTIILQRK